MKEGPADQDPAWCCFETPISWRALLYTICVANSKNLSIQLRFGTLILDIVENPFLCSPEGGPIFQALIPANYIKCYVIDI